MQIPSSIVISHSLASIVVFFILHYTRVKESKFQLQSSLFFSLFPEVLSIFECLRSDTHTHTHIHLQKRHSTSEKFSKKVKGKKERERERACAFSQTKVLRERKHCRQRNPSAYRFAFIRVHIAATKKTLLSSLCDF